jgi:hypothetical protein
MIPAFLRVRASFLSPKHSSLHRADPCIPSFLSTSSVLRVILPLYGFGNVLEFPFPLNRPLERLDSFFL